MGEKEEQRALVVLAARYEEYQKHTSKQCTIIIMNN